MAEYEVGYDGLDALLKGLPENTAAEPYEIELTEVTAEFLRGSAPAQQGTLQYILQNNTSKYVSLSFSNDCDSILGALTNAASMFQGCTSLTSVDVSGMTSVTVSRAMFYDCTLLTSVDVSGMTAVIDATSMFGYCLSLTSVDVSGMTAVIDATSMFLGCTSLEEIHGWEIPLTEGMRDCFSACSSLRTIYVPKRIPEESASWHVWDVRKDTANSRSTVRIYSEDGSYVSANVPSGDSWSMEIPGKTDELYFSAGSSITQEHMQKMLATRVPVTSKSGVLDPARDNFVLMAKDPSSFKTNFVTDTVAAGNSFPVSSKGVAAKVSATEAALRAAITSLESLLCPVGMIIQYGGSSDTVPVGWLLCDGRAVSRSVYSNLFKTIGTFFGSGNGSTTFNLPDMRQVTPQGCGRNSRNFSGDDDILSLGEIKENQLQEHTHPYLLASNRRRKSAGSGNQIWEYEYWENTQQNSGRKGQTTHGNIIGVNYIIKY